MDKNIEELVKEAASLRKANNYIAALKIYEELYEFVDFNLKIDILFKIADSYLEMKDNKNAFLSFKNISEIDKQNAGAYYGMAISREMDGNFIDALELFEKAIEIDRDYKEAYYYAATIYGDLGYIDNAIEYLNRVIEIDNLDFIAYSDLGSIYENSGNYEVAKYNLKKSIEINNSYYLSHFNLGVVYKNLKDYDKAIEEYEKALLYSNDYRIYLNMSALYIEIDKLKDALNILNRGIEKNAHHILYYNRACVYSKLGNYLEASKDYNIAKEIDDIVEKWAENDPDLAEVTNL